MSELLITPGIKFLKEHARAFVCDLERNTSKSWRILGLTL